MKDKEKSYKIKIPIFTTEIVGDSDGIFGRITYSDMIEDLKSKINSIQSESSFDNRNKTKKTVISKVNFTEHTIGDVPSLLLQISAYSTNITDGYFEATEKIAIQKDNKLGSETNFVLIYPIIKGIDSQNFTRHFLVVMYEDPTKDNGYVLKIGKIVVNQLLGIPIQNLKLPTILDELKSLKEIPELQIKYYGTRYDENEIDVKYQEFYQSGKITKSKEDFFKNMPFEKVEEIINEPCGEEYQTKTTKVFWGKKEYRISKEMVQNIKEAKEELKETAEKIFNMSAPITQIELDEKSVHNQDFIIEKLSGALSNYLSSYNE